MKVHLDESRAYRQQEEECELVRHQIAQHPPRAESEAAIVSLQQELEALEKENVAASQVLDLRRKQFSLLLQTVSLHCLVIPILYLLPQNRCHSVDAPELGSLQDV